MSTETSDCTGAELRERILSDVAATVSQDCFDTWFRPLGPVFVNGNILKVTVPNQTFRAGVSGHYTDLLCEAAQRIVGVAELKLSISVQEEPRPGVAGNNHASPFPVVRASQLEVPAIREAWLIEHLWTHQAVGVIGGCPKSGKTWLALEMAVAVAAGNPCLGVFPVRSPGSVLL